jgi:Dolichyl-phosphate-mannose-protein mannosyltransferase
VAYDRPVPIAPVGTSETAGRPLCRFATPGVLAVGAALGALLIAFSGRYGYHRDELYFIECGRHLSWGYPDQPPLVPLLARLMTSLCAHSLVVLRLPSAIAMVALVILTALNARELGAGQVAQVLAAACMAVAPLTLGTGHLLSTTTFDVPVWAAETWLAIRILRTGDDRLWVPFGIVAGIGLFDSDLVAFLAFGIAAGLAVCGPRSHLRSGWLYLGALIAVALWTPYLVWQGSHGWPELTISRSIAAGGSGTSTPRWELLPEQVLLSSVYLSPVWIAGLVRLLRGRSAPGFRALGVAYAVLVVVFLVTGGKAYYLGGMFPLLFAAGSQPAVDWVLRAGTPGRRRLLVAAVLLSLTSLPVTLPVVPVTAVHDTPIVSLNYDAGETIGWPTYVHQIAAVYDSLPSGARANTVILASNYGEAGAVDEFGPADGIPNAYSGHNAFWYWGPPPASAETAVAVGFARSDLVSFCGDLRLAGHLDNGLDVSDDEQGQPVWVCTAIEDSWSVIWPGLRHFG